MYQQTKLFKEPTQPNKNANKPVVFLIKLDFPEDKPVKVFLPKKMDLLLKRATEALHLIRPAKHFYDEEGMPFMNIEEIPPKATLYVSSADIETEEIEGDELVLLKKKPKRNKYPTLPLMTEKPSGPEIEGLQEHIKIAKEHNTVKENLRDSLLCLFSSLNDEQKASLNCSDSLETLLESYQIYFMQHQLLANFIGPSKYIGNSDVGQIAQEWAMEKLREIKIEFCKFVITGPTQSGKSTLLYFASMLFYQKLQIAKQAQNYLIFPINWRLHLDIIDNLPKLYQFYLQSTLIAIKGVKLEILPILPELQKWFENLIIMKSFVNFPPNVVKLDRINLEVLRQYGKRVQDSFLSKNGPEEFASLITTMPNVFAEALGLQGAIYIMDHFDCCAYQVEKDGKECDLSHFVCQSIEKSPFFLATKNDYDFYNIFEIQKYKQWSTTGIINTNSYSHAIVISEPTIEITLDMCQGCPGYCNTFLRLIEMINESKNKMGIKRPNLVPYQSVTDICRRTYIKNEIIRFSVLIGGSEANVIDSDKMNQLMMKDFDFMVRESQEPEEFQEEYQES